MITLVLFYRHSLTVQLHLTFYNIKASLDKQQPANLFTTKPDFKAWRKFAKKRVKVQNTQQRKNGAEEMLFLWIIKKKTS